MTLYPWQQPQWQNLQQSRRQGRLPHAILLTGPQGLGKEAFALYFAQSLLCEKNSANGEPCGQCRSCLLYLAGNHPDVTVVTPLEGKKNIGVDQVREIGHYLALKAQYSGHRVVVLTPAETMNVNSANSLLKTLEEPSAGTVLVLVTHRPAQLPATIRSRCQEIRFGTVAPEVGAAWLTARGNGADSELLLALADGSPLKAARFADDNMIQARLEWFQALEALAKQGVDPIEIAAKAAKSSEVKSNPGNSVYWLYAWSVDMVRLKTCQQPPHLANRDIQPRLLNLAERVSLKTLMVWLERVQGALREVEGNFNATLVLEGLLIQWQRMFAAPAARS